MQVDFGHVQEYNTARGFGFVSRTFRNVNRQRRKNVYFHIKTIKRDYPDLAKELDIGSLVNINFWYEVDNNDSEKVSEVWLDPKDIPKQRRDSLVAHIEQLWCNADNVLPEWLDHITLALVGQARKDELNQLRDDQICKQNEIKEQEQKQRQSRLEQVLRSNKQTQSSEARIQILLDYTMNNQLPSARDRFRAERGVIEAIFSSDMHGLPPALKAIAQQCPRQSRKNPLSHQPGGSDIIVTYSLGHVILYDWIKDVVLYIRAFQKSNPEFHLEIQSIYGRFCEEQSERRIGVFSSIWDRDKDGESAHIIEACLKRYQRQMDIGHKTLHEEAKKYWKSYGLSDQQVENLPTIYKQHISEKKGE